MSHVPLAAFALTLAAAIGPAGTASDESSRPRLGLALGGGAARGIAHVGVLEWLEEQRIPVDFVAGTSMGGLVGGAYATGLSPSEVRELLRSADWGLMFLGESPYRSKQFRRKEDRRRFPVRLELGLKDRLRPPSGLEPGHQIGLLLSRVSFPHTSRLDFDALPTPFRSVATDMTEARAIVLEDGSLAQALLATMAIPGVFPPVERDGRILADGGLSFGYQLGDVASKVRIGDPGRPAVAGKEELARLRFVYDGHDAPVIPSSGGRLTIAVDWFRNAPLASRDFGRAELELSTFWPLGNDDRLFFLGRAGSLFGGPSPFLYELPLGGPLRLGSFDLEEFRGERMLLGGIGYLRGVGHLPPFLGGRLYATGLVELGSAFDVFDEAELRKSGTAGLLMDTFFGALLVAGSLGDDGSSKFYFILGTVFP